MTEATIISRDSFPKTTPAMRYEVAMPQPENHLFEVTLTVENWHSKSLDLKMPVWTPGSYLVREYARHLQDFSACDSQGNKLGFHKVSKHHWRVETAGNGQITIFYRVYANELTVRTNHLDRTHGYFNGAALFFWIPDSEKEPITVKITPPAPDWQVVVPLPEIAKNTFRAEDFDTLVDSPFEVGIHQNYEFIAEGKPHQFVVWGEGNLDIDRIIKDVKKVIAVEAELFNDLPYDRYIFLLHLAASGGGGLEHKNSCTLNYPRFNFRDTSKYNRFIQLVAHEFFHLWNVKRLRPKELEVFDYEQENYTPSLWFSEGTTSYYDVNIPYRAGIYDQGEFLKNLSQEITRYLTTPGRNIQPLSESSWDAWIKLYRPNENTPNSQMSYYLKGEMVSLLLDLLIRTRHNNQRSLDDVLRQMWERFGKAEIGFTALELKQVIEAVAGEDLTDFFNRYIHGLDELPFNHYLEPFGLELNPEVEDVTPFLGVHLKPDGDRTVVKWVETGSPAQIAGLDAEDEILALDGYRVTSAQLNDRLKDYHPGQPVSITVFHQDQLQTHTVTLAAPRPSKYQLQSVASPTPIQKQLLSGWLQPS